MIKQFIKDTGIYGISGLISRGVSIFLVPFYTRVLTPNDYGIMDIIAVFYSIVAVTIPLEITQAIARFLADKKEDNFESDKNTILVSSIGIYFTIITFGLFLIIGLLINNWLTKILLDDPAKSSILITALFHMFFTGLFYFFQNQLRWTLKAKKVAILSVLYTVVNISFTVLFVLFIKTGVIGVFYAYIISAAACSLLGFYYSKENYAVVFSISKLKEMLKFSLPLVPSSVGVFFINSGQRVIIKGLMTLSDLGLFGVGSRLSSIINLGFQSVQGAITPLIYQNAEKKETPENLAKIFRYLSFFLSVLFVIMSLFASEIFILLTTPAYYSAYILVPFLVLSESFGGLQRSFSPGMAIKKRTDIIAYINIFGAVFALAFSFILIYFFGIVGAAIAMLVQSIEMFIIQLYYSQKFFFVPYPLKKIFIVLILAVLLVLFGWFLPITNKLIMILPLKVFIIILFLIITIKVIKLITFEEIQLIYNKVKWYKK